MTSPIRSLLGLFLLLSTSSYAVAQVRSPQSQAELPEPQTERQAPLTARASLVAQTSTAEPLSQPAAQAEATETTSVQVFRLDNQCEDFVGTVTQLPRANAIDEAVRAAIQKTSTLEFQIAGYRIVEGTAPNEVTVDFRLAPDAVRSLESLSVCEGRSLYGSIRRTLTANGQFGVNQVRFALDGRELR